MREVTSLVDDNADPEDVQRREYAGVEAALRADDLGVLLRRDALRALPALHRHLTTGLVATPSAGLLRRIEPAARIINEPVNPVIKHPSPLVT